MRDSGPSRTGGPALWLPEEALPGCRGRWPDQLRYSWWTLTMAVISHASRCRCGGDIHGRCKRHQTRLLS
jgi:hypothetical protein